MRARCMYPYAGLRILHGVVILPLHFLLRNGSGFELNVDAQAHDQGPEKAEIWILLSLSPEIVFSAQPLLQGHRLAVEFGQFLRLPALSRARHVCDIKYSCLRCGTPAADSCAHLHRAASIAEKDTVCIAWDVTMVEQSVEKIRARYTHTTFADRPFPDRMCESGGEIDWRMRRDEALFKSSFKGTRGFRLGHASLDPTDIIVRDGPTVCATDKATCISACYTTQTHRC